MRFKNREEAGRVLAIRLAEHKKERPVILAIPKGALPIGKAVAQVLDASLDVILAKKIGAPNNPELAIGAVSETGDVYLTDVANGLSHQYLEDRVATEFKKIVQKRKSYASLRPQVDLKDRIVILVDDGIATGATMLSAIKSARHRGAQKVLVAALVAPPDTVSRLKQEADEVEVIFTPTFFSHVSEFFEDFSQVSDKEVKEILTEENLRENLKEASATALENSILTNCLN